MSGSGSGSRAISENPARNPVASARRKAVWSILAVSRRPIGANSLSGFAPRYSPDMTRLRVNPKVGGCSGRAGKSLHRRADRWQAR